MRKSTKIASGVIAAGVLGIAVVVVTASPDSEPPVTTTNTTTTATAVADWASGAGEIVVDTSTTMGEFSDCMDRDLTEVDSCVKRASANLHINATALSYHADMGKKIEMPPSCKRMVVLTGKYANDLDDFSALYTDGAINVDIDQMTAVGGRVTTSAEAVTKSTDSCLKAIA